MITLLTIHENKSPLKKKKTIQMTIWKLPLKIRVHMMFRSARIHTKGSIGTSLITRDNL